MKIKASYHQERLWFIDKFEAGNLYKSAPVYHNIPLILYLQGPIDTGILERSIHEVIHRHEALRTKIITIHNEPLQCIEDKVEFKLTIFDLPGPGKEHEDTGRYEQALHLAVEDSKKPFLLDKEMLIRGTLIPIQEKKCLLVLTLHHLISDRYSLGIITREIFIYYQAFLHGAQPKLPDLPLHYADFSQWQREFSGDFLESLLAYWKRKLSGKLQALQLPTDYPRPAIHTFQEGRFPFSLGKTLYDKIESTAQREKTTHFIVLLAAFKILLHRYSHLDEIILGTSAFNRQQPETRGIVGPLANLLVLRDNINGSSNFSKIAADLTKTVTQAFKHMDLPFDRIVTELKPGIDMSRTALFDVLFQYDETPFPATRIDNLEVSMIETNLGWGKYDLNMFIQKGEDAFSGILVYNKEYYKHPGISRLIDHYKVLLESIFQHPGDMAAKLIFLTEKEKQQLLVEWNRTAANYPEDKTLHRLFKEQVERTPDNIALVGPLEKEYKTYRTYRTYISYQELDDKSDQLAYYLIEKGVTTDTIIGIMVQRSVEMIIAILGILKAGGAYLPIDPGYPEERIDYMLKDSGTPVLLTAPAIEEAINKSYKSHMSYISPGNHPAAGSRQPATSLAYIIYTSGTSGYPKGCLLSHRNVIRLFINDKHPFTFDEHDVWIMAHSYCFDFSVWEMYGALLFGGKLIVPGWASVQDTGSFLSIIKKHQVTILNQTPGAFYNLIEEEKKSPGKALDKHLRCVCFGGDKLEPAYLKEWVDIYPLEKLCLINMYGITETTVHVTYHRLKTAEIRSPGLNSPIGRPLPETTLYIYDNNLNILPIGVPGELYVGGSGVARGYLNKPELTSKRFKRAVISHSSLVNGSSSQFSTNDQCPMTNDRSSRLYQTGDMGRWVDDGNVEYLGRIDDQVKIRGYRIEPGEITAHLLTNKKISKAIVLAVEDMDKNKRLAAYFVAEEEIPNNELRGYLKKFLPDHMIPGFFIQLDRLPLTASGKIDKQALPGPGTASTSAAVYQAPRNKTEALLVDIWQEILGIEKIGINDDFFSLGGDSLNGIRVVNEIQERLGEIVHIAALFQYPTIKEFSEKLESYREEDSGSKINAAKVTELRKLIPPLPPLSFPGPKNKPVIFILSPYRSGSTLLRIILGGHSQIFAPPELELLSFNTLSERKAALSGIYLFEGTIRAIMAAKPCDVEEAQAIMETCEKQGFTSYQFYRMIQQWLGNKILADKTPSYSFDLDILKRAELYFQSPQYIHLLRNPYAVIHSFKQAKIDQVIRFKHPFTVQELAELLWVISHQNILEFLKEIPPQRKHLLKFEELVKEPGAVTAGICRFLGLPYEEKMLDVYENTPTRMTDGIYPESRMIGDIKFLQHSTINEKVADDWQKDHKKDFLGDITRQLASTWGYFPGTITSRYIFKTREVKSLPLEPVEKKEYYPVSSAQKRLYILDRLDPGNTGYNMPQAIPLKETGVVNKLEETFRKLIARHESLRTSFITVNDEPVQKIHDEVEFEIEDYEMKEVEVKVKDGDTEGTRGLAPLSLEDFIRPFDLSQAPLLRVGLIPIPPFKYPSQERKEQEYVLMVDIHHIISDGISRQILVKDFMAILNGKQLPWLRLQYKDFARWQDRKKETENLHRQERYWLREFETGIPVLNLPTDFPRPALQSFEGSTEKFEISADDTGILKSMALEQKATLYMVLLTLFNVFLSKLSDQEHVVIGTPVAGRRHANLEKIIGMFVNTLALQNFPNREKTFRDFLIEIKERTLQAFENQEYQFEDLVDKLSVNRDASRNPLFDIMYILQNFDGNPRERKTYAKQEQYGVQQGISKFDMTFNGLESGEELVFTVEYCTKLFKKETIKRFIKYFKNIVSSILEKPGRRLSEIDILTKKEKHQILYDFNDTAADYPKNKTIHQLFAEQAARTPDYAAVVVPLQVKYRTYMTHMTYISYRELNKQSNRTARLLGEQGVHPDTIVGIMLEPSIEMIIGILGILKAGGAYLPIDPDYPQERIDYMLKDSGAKILLTEQEIANLSSPQALYLSEGRSFTNDQLAYIIYTSGSTGRPKGVALEHQSVINTLLYRKKEYRINPHGTFLQLFSFAFDGFVTSFFTPIIAGARVILLSRKEIKDVSRIKQAVLKHKITHFICIPVLFQRIIESLEPGETTSLEVVTLAGDTVPPHIIDNAKQENSSLEIVNEYGVTEAAVMSTIYRHQEKDTVAKIGKPIWNTRIYILGSDCHAQPIGVPGELCIAGLGTARGYLNQPQLTAKKFNHDAYHRSYRSYKSYIPHLSYYKTGDLARWLPDGNIEFIGRVDYQLKIRGFRIELGEIENQLLNHEAVKEAVVTAREEENQDKYLCAYTVLNKEISSRELREYLAGELPDYMIPSYFVSLEKIPLTPNGKIDRKRLPAPELKAIEEYTAPRTPGEKKLAEIWAEVLGIGKNLIGIDHNFFDLGGHSLKATILISRIHKKLDTKLSLDRVFKFPTIRGLSACLATAARERFSPIKAMEKKKFYELTFNQKRLWYIQQKTPGTTSYHIGEVIFLDHRVDIEALQSALKKLSARHESLRTGFAEVKGKPVQFVLEMEDSDLPFQVRDVSALEEEERKHQTAQIITEVTDPPFDLRKPSLFRAALIKQHTENYLLVYNMHHIISDGWSMEILKKDFNRYYSDYANGKEPLWEPLLLQYKDFAHWHNEQIRDPGHKDQAYKYWKKKVETGFPMLELTHHYHSHYTRDNRHNANAGGGWYRCAADQILKERLHRLAQKNQTSLFMVLFSIYNLLMAFLSGQDEVVSVVISAGRQHDSLHPIVGYFINPIIIKTHIILQEDFENLLSRINREVLEVLQYQEYPLELVLDDMKKEFPQVGISFNMLNMQDISTETELDSLTSHHNKIHKDMKFDIALSVLEYRNGIDFNWGYRSTIFNTKTMENFAQKYLELMEDLTLDDESKS